MAKSSRKHRRGDRHKSAQQPYLDAFCESGAGVYIFTTSGVRLKAIIFHHDNNAMIIGELNAPTFRKMLAKRDIAFIRPIEEPQPEKSPTKSNKAKRPQIKVKKRPTLNLQ